MKTQLRKPATLLLFLLALLALCAGPLQIAHADAANLSLATQDKTDPNDLDVYYAAATGKPGETLTVYLPLHNAGGEATDVLCTLKAMSAQLESPAVGTPAAPVHASAPVTIASGAKAVFSLSVKIRSDAAAGDGRIAFQLDYKENGAPAAPVTLEVPFRVNVPVTPTPAAPATPMPAASVTPTPTPADVPDADYEIVYETGSSSGGGGGSGFKSKPKVIVSGYTFDSEKLYAGESFKMNLKLRNTSQREAVKNLQINFSNEAGVVMPVSGGSNTIFVGELARETSVSMNIGLQIVPDAEPKAQMLHLEITYEGTKNKQEFTEKTTVAIPVMQRTRVRTDAPAFYDEAFAGQSCSMSVQLFNMGKSSLYNCMVSVEGEGLSLEETYYAGNIASGGTLRADLSLVAATAGEIPGNVHITYEDVYGDQSEEVLPFTLTVSESAPLDPMAADAAFATGGSAALSAFSGMPDGAERPGFAWYWWVLVAAFLTVLVGIVLLKRRRARMLTETYAGDEPDDSPYAFAAGALYDAENGEGGDAGNDDEIDDVEATGRQRRRRTRKER